MRRFVFPLERVAAWRRARLQLEEARLTQLFVEKDRIEQRRDDLERELLEAAKQALSGPELDASQLAALDGFRHAAQLRLLSFESELTQCGQRIAEQQSRVATARRDCRLLDRLRDRKLAAWNRQQGQELEALAAESHLARLVRERR
jgi:hypothetical protein